MGMQVSQ
jgi:hypothetical protein